MSLLKRVLRIARQLRHTRPSAVCTPSNPRRTRDHTLPYLTPPPPLSKPSYPVQHQTPSPQQRTVRYHFLIISPSHRRLRLEQPACNCALHCTAPVNREPATSHAGKVIGVDPGARASSSTAAAGGRARSSSSFVRPSCTTAKPAAWDVGACVHACV